MAITMKGMTRATNPYAFFEPREEFAHRWFRDFDRLFNGAEFPFRPRHEAREVAWMPDLEVFERDNHLTVRLDVPGLKKEELTVTVAETVLTIEGERREEAEETKNQWHHRERTYGKFFRAVSLPEGVNASQVTATFKDGVLEITVPKPAAAVEAPPTKVEIRGAEAPAKPIAA